MNYGNHVRDLLVELKRSEEAMVTANGGTQQDIGKLATVAITSYNDQSVRAALQDFTLHVQELKDQADAATSAAAAAAAGTATTTTTTTTTTAAKPSLTVRPSLLLQSAACHRNKRGLLLYHIIRMQRIQDLLYWQSGVSGDSRSMNQAATATTSSNSTSRNVVTDTTDTTNVESVVLQNLCPSEKEFLYNYQQLIHDYMNEQELQSVSIFDLRAHCTVPPMTVDRVVCRVIDTTPFVTTATTNDAGHNDNDDNDPDQTSNSNNINTIVLESGQCVNFTMGSTHYLIYSDCEEYIRSGALQIVDSEEV